MVTSTTQAFMQRRLAALRHRHLFRQTTPLDHSTAPWITVGDRTFLNLSSNNYLGLADHPKLKEAATLAIRDYGCGTGASRLITGTSPLHEQLEQRLAAFKGSEQALLFASGYHANMGVVSSFVGSRDIVLGDELNHASIIDGCRLSGAEYTTYPHCDTLFLAQQLEKLDQIGHRGIRLVVTDSVFSMDGDVAPLAEIVSLCHKYNALLVVDEAHATGCLGPGGRGLLAQLGLETDVTASVSTLSKAFGVIGAFVSSNHLVKEFLINVARHFIFTTALPPADVAASLAALDILEEEPERPIHLQQKATFLRTGLQALGLQTMASETQIIPILVGDSMRALQMAHALREHGVYAVAIRPPTVPMGAARIRFSVMASHTENDLAFALDVIKKVVGKQGEILGPIALDHSSLESYDKQYLWHPFTQQQDWETDPQLIITRAEGCYLIDDEGRSYLDGVSSLWANLHGHQHPIINTAIRQQLEKVAHTTMLGLSHPSAILLGKRLVELAPGHLNRVFYSDTGSAAIEIALKIAYQYWQQIDPPQPHKISFLSITNDYHGDTVGAMSVGGISTFRHAYTSLCFPTIAVDATIPCTCGNQPTCTSYNMPCLSELERTISQHAHEMVAVVMEPLFQGASGIHVYPDGYTRAVWAMTKRYGVLFIVDEIATGFGRTGKMFACEHEGIEPDIMAIAKGLSGGYLPLAATLTTEEIYRAFLGAGHTFYHGHTYTGNPLACAAALANLDIFEQEDTLKQLQPRIIQLRQGLERLRTLPLVADTRQCGFAGGIELAQNKDLQLPFPPEQKVAVRVVKEARTRGVILRPLSDVIVIMPPLVISEQELTLLLDVVQASIIAVAEELNV